MGNEDMPSVFDRLGVSREDFCITLRRVLEEGISCEYSGQLSEAIAQAVAEDVLECADSSDWNASDVRLGAGRVLLRTMQIFV